MANLNYAECFCYGKNCNENEICKESFNNNTNEKSYQCTTPCKNPYWNNSTEEDLNLKSPTSSHLVGNPQFRCIDNFYVKATQVDNNII